MVVLMVMDGNDYYDDYDGDDYFMDDGDILSIWLFMINNEDQRFDSWFYGWQ